MLIRRQFLGALGAASLAAACAPMGGHPDIVSIASTNDQFSTLVAALSSAELVETLEGPGPFTVFAPSNAAFERLPAGTVDSLLLPENREQLTSILTYHVVPGRITSDQFAGQRRSVGTVQGSTVEVDATSGGVMVDGATVTSADITASNGVIHRIDRVLMP